MEEKKLNDLKKSIRFLGAGSIDQDVDAMIKADFKETDIKVAPSRVRGHGVSVVLHFSQDSNHNHYLNAFTITVQPRIEIIHETIGSVSTRDLDIRMSKADWNIFPHQDKIATMTEAQILAAQKNLSLRDELIALSTLGSKEALQIQEQLAVKYFKGNAWAGAWQDLELADARHTRPSLTQTFPTQYHERYSIYDAVALLTGAAVYKQVIPFEGKQQENVFPAGGTPAEKEERDMRPFRGWVVIDFEKKKDNGQFWKSFLHKDFYQDQSAPKPKFDLGAKLDEFDLIENRNPIWRQNRINTMESGLAAQFHYAKDGKEHTVYVSANPKYNTLTFRDTDGKMLKHEQIPRFDMAKVQATQASLEATGNELKQRISGGMITPTRGTAQDVQGQINQANVTAADRSRNVTAGNNNVQQGVSR